MITKIERHLIATLQGFIPAEFGDEGPLQYTDNQVKALSVKLSSDQYRKLMTQGPFCEAFKENVNRSLERLDLEKEVKRKAHVKSLMRKK